MFSGQRILNGQQFRKSNMRSIPWTTRFRERPLSTSCQSIECRSDLSLEDFRNEFFEQKPVILKQSFIDFPAIKKWHANDYAHLRHYGSFMMPVEITYGNTTYANANGSSRFEKVELPLQVFLDAINQVSNTSTEAQASEDNLKLYLAQHSLFDTIPELYADVCLPSFVKCTTNDKSVPKYATVKHGDIYNINAWIGLSTHTPLHKDPYHNIFVQLHSHKSVIIFPPAAHASLHLHTDRLLKNTSRIKDIFEPCQRDAMDPAVRASAFEATVKSGDGLYIPEGWFHSFKGDHGLSSSVNWWFR